MKQPWLSGILHVRQFYVSKRTAESHAGSVRKRFSWSCPLTAWTDAVQKEYLYGMEERCSNLMLLTQGFGVWFVVSWCIFPLLVIWTMESNLCSSHILTIQYSGQETEITSVIFEYTGHCRMLFSLCDSVQGERLCAVRNGLLIKDDTPV